MPAKNSAESQVADDSSHDETRTATQPAAAGKKPRSKVERAIVWGGILILLGVMLVELTASRAFTSDFTAAQEALGNGPVTESDIRQLITKHSSVESNPDLTANRLVATREDKYTYGGLLKERVLYVYYGVVLPHEKEADVLDVTLERTEFFDATKKQPPGDGAATTETSVAPPTAPPTEAPPTEAPTEAASVEADADGPPAP